MQPHSLEGGGAPAGGLQPASGAALYSHPKVKSKARFADAQAAHVLHREDSGDANQGFAARRVAAVGPRQSGKTGYASYGADLLGQMVPRRARSALNKRPGDAWLTSVKKARTGAGSFSRPTRNRSPGQGLQTVETAQEQEVAEALFDLANMFASDAQHSGSPTARQAEEHHTPRLNGAGLPSGGSGGSGMSPGAHPQSGLAPAQYVAGLGYPAGASGLGSWPSAGTQGSGILNGGARGEPMHAQPRLPPMLAKPWKRCASHVFIAHFIEYQSQLERYQHNQVGSAHGYERQEAPADPPQHEKPVARSAVQQTHARKVGPSWEDIPFSQPTKRKDSPLQAQLSQHAAQQPQQAQQQMPSQPNGGFPFMAAPPASHLQGPFGNGNAGLTPQQAAAVFPAFALGPHNLAGLAGFPPALQHLAVSSAGGMPGLMGQQAQQLKDGRVQNGDGAPLKRPDDPPNLNHQGMLVGGLRGMTGGMMDSRGPGMPTAVQDHMMAAGARGEQPQDIWLNGSMPMLR
ncbi:hypothetical protein WJX72_006167 [[Myrmecia] bisecta]|uniref:Uncharacterized protein n=1 Tax=[Myrmecia] bisecta TaxID=41462 RepID=A0AAW1PCA9_9CHLO